MRYLLLAADDDVAEALAKVITGTVPGVEITEHGHGCCCQNCPWKGNHGD